MLMLTSREDKRMTMSISHGAVVSYDKQALQAMPNKSLEAMVAFIMKVRGQKSLTGATPCLNSDGTAVTQPAW
jgi:hypothetical protein